MKLVPIIIFFVILLLLFKDKSAQLLSKNGFASKNVYISIKEIENVILNSSDEKLQQQLKRIIFYRKLMYISIVLLFVSVIVIAFLSNNGNG